MPKVPYPYEVNGKLVTGNGSLIPICSLSKRSLLPSLTVCWLCGKFLYPSPDFCQNWCYHNEELKIKAEEEVLKQVLYEFLQHVSLNKMCQIKLDFVQNSEEADYVLKNDNVFPGATNKNVAYGQYEVISYAREVVETLRYPNLSLNNDEVTLELVKE